MTKPPLTGVSNTAHDVDVDIDDDDDDDVLEYSRSS